MDTINRQLQRNGVDWLACRDCGRQWPFPRAPRSSAEHVFTCPVCVNAELAALKRKVTTMEREHAQSGHGEAQIGPVARLCHDCHTEVFVTGTDAERIVRCRRCQGEINLQEERS